MREVEKLKIGQINKDVQTFNESKIRVFVYLIIMIILINLGINQLINTSLKKANSRL